MSKKVLEISVRADLGGGPKHLLGLLTTNQTKIETYSAIPLGYFFSDAIVANSTGSFEIPHRKFSLISILKLIKFCREKNIKLVHSHGRGAGYYSRVMKLFGFKVVHTLHGVHVEKTLISKAKVIIDKLLVPLTDHFICVSESEFQKAEKFKVINKTKTTIISNGVQVSSLKEMKTQTPPQIAMLGRLSFPKGYDILIKYIDSYCKEFPRNEFHINIAGDGEESSKLFSQLENSSHAKEKISFLGKVDKPDIFLQENSHFLSFSRFEGMPLSVLEAINQGLPCMVSEVTGNTDIINKDNGLLFDLNSYESFKSTFTHFLNDTQRIKRNRAYKDLVEKFDINKQRSKTFSLYESLT